MLQRPPLPSLSYHQPSERQYFAYKKNSQCGDRIDSVGGEFAVLPWCRASHIGPASRQQKEAIVYFRRLCADKSDDVHLAAKFICACPGYKLQTFGKLPSVDDEGRNLLSGFPAECAPRDRLVFAAQAKSGATLGLVQVARAHPQGHLAHIGLLLVSQDQRRQHLGCRMLEHLSRQARQWGGITHWQLSVLNSNSAGLEFWRHCGFHTVAQGCYSSELLDRGCVMERPIKTKPLCQSHRPPERNEELMANRLLAVLR